MTPRQEAITAARVQLAGQAEVEARLVNRLWGSDREAAKHAPRRKWIQLESGQWTSRDPSRRLQTMIDLIAAEKQRAEDARIAARRDVVGLEMSGRIANG